MRASMQRLFAWLVIVLIPLVVLELASYAFVRWHDGWFSHRDDVLSRLAAEGHDYASFLERRYHPVYGWDRPPAQRWVGKDCLGREIEVTTNEDRSRLMPEVAAGPELLLVGDSFTAGVGVNDAETFAWRLAEGLDRPVRNHGVGGFGPVQAVLKFEAIADAYPDVAVVVLGIMHQNVQRMLSRYRPLVQPETGLLFGFKPYMAGGVVQPNPNGPEPRPLAELSELATAAFAEDFMALPEPSFPYSLAVARLVVSPQFWLPIGEDEQGTLAHYYAEPAIWAEFEALIERYVAEAESRRIEPVVLFLPRHRFDRLAPEPAIAALERRFGDRMTIVAIGRTEMDWGSYLIGEGSCHPSPDGHAAIAEALAPVLAAMLASGAAGRMSSARAVAQAGQGGVAGLDACRKDGAAGRGVEGGGGALEEALGLGFGEWCLAAAGGFDRGTDAGGEAAFHAGCHDDVVAEGEGAGGTEGEAQGRCDHQLADAARSGHFGKASPIFCRPISLRARLRPARRNG
jgi:hypothetical protein